MSRSISDKKISLIKWLTTVEDELLLEQIEKVKDNAKNDLWDELSEAERLSIKAGIKDFEEGRVSSHADIKREYDWWE